MKRKFRKIVSLLLVVLMMVSSVSCGKKQTSDSGNYITRGTWLEKVATTFGFNEYTSSTPYFEDINSSSSLFAYAQSCYEWGVISTASKTYNPDSVATLGFVASSAVMALVPWQELSNEQVLEKAVEYGFLTTDENKQEELVKGVSDDRAERILALAMVVAFKDNTEIIDKVELVEGVNSEFATATSDIEFVSEGKYLVSAAVAAKCTKDAILIFPDAESQMVSVKVTGTEAAADGRYYVSTVQPEFEEVVSELDIEGTRDVDFNNFVPEEGVAVTVSSTKKSSGFTTVGTRYVGDSKGTSATFSLSLKSKDGKAPTLSSKVAVTSKDGSVFSLGMDSTGKFTASAKNGNNQEFKLDIVTSSNLDDSNVKQFFDSKKILDMYDPSLENQISDYNSGVSDYDKLVAGLTTQNDITQSYSSKPYESSWEITGSIKLEDFKVTPSIKFGTTLGVTNITKFERAELKVSGKIELSASLEGKISEDKLIGSVVIPTSVPGVSIRLYLYLHADANGKLSVTYTFDVNESVEMKKGASPVYQHNTTASQEFEASVSLKFGPKLAVAVNFIGFDLMSLSAGAYVQIDVTAKSTRTPTISKTDEAVSLKIDHTLSLSADVYLPIVEIGLNDTSGNILGKLGFKASITAVSKKMIEDGKVGIHINLFSKEIDGAVSFSYSFPVYDDSYVVPVNNNLELERWNLLLDIGAKEKLVLNNIPEGYSEGDLIWESSDSSVATVNNGTVSGLTDGVVTITVKTSDGVHEDTCTVYVFEVD